MKTSELTGNTLDWAVAKCEETHTHYQAYRVVDGQLYAMFCDAWLNSPYLPSTDWSLGGPIIEREKIEIRRGNPLYFPKGNENGDHYEPLWLAGKQHGTTPLIAAMLCYVASKLGDEVDIPKELL